jgi:hypothetical protein
MRWRFVVAALVLSVIALQRADAITLCEKRSGRVAALERCGKRDAAITPADIGLVGLAGPTGVTGGVGPNGQMPLRIVDAAGHDVCAVVSAGAEPQCVLTHATLTRPVLLTFTTLPLATGIGVGASEAYYTVPGCAGQPYVRNGRPLLPPASLIGSALFYATGEDSNVTPQSFEAVVEPCPGTPTARGTCCQPYTAMSARFVAPATRVDVSELGLAFPFATVTP